MMDDQQVAVFEAKLADLMDADVEHFKATRYRDEDGWVGYDGLGQWYSELADTLAMMAAAAWQAAKADSAQGAEPVAYPDCDTCGGSMNYMPWHYATETERHLHACNECCPKVNPAHPAAKVPEETEAMVDAAVKVFEDAGVAVDLGWLGEACRAYVAAASTTPQQSGEWVRCSERLPTEADADCDQEIWFCWSNNTVERRHYKRVQLDIHHDCYWMPTGLKRPNPPKQENE